MILMSNPSGSNQILNNILVMDDPGYSPFNFHRKSGQNPISNVNVINNHFIYRNTDSYGTNYFPYVLIEGGSNLKISHNAVFKADGIAPAGGPYSNDVWMQSPQLTSFNGFDFHLLSSSPLINAGANPPFAIENDFDVHPCPQNADYDCHSQPRLFLFY